jgi:hypothetical protein
MLEAAPLGPAVDEPKGAESGCAEDSADRVEGRRAHAYSSGAAATAWAISVSQMTTAW